MNKDNKDSQFSKFTLLLDCIREAIQSRQYIYSLSEIKLAQKKEDATIKFHLVGVGKESESVSLLSIYNNDEMLLKFRPSDIKLISTTAALIQTSQDKYNVIYMQLKTEKNDFMISLKNVNTSEKFRMKLSQLMTNKALLENISGKDAFMLGKRYGEISAVNCTKN